MTVPPPEPGTEGRASLAARLKELRAAAGLSGNALAHRMGVVQSRVWKIENGRLMPTETDIAAWVQAAGAPGEVTRELLGMLAKARTEQAFGTTLRGRGAPAAFQERVRAIEEQSERIGEFEVAVIPGILQTADYIRQLVSLPGGLRTWGADDAAIEDMVIARLRRQENLKARARNDARNGVGLAAPASETGASMTAIRSVRTAEGKFVQVANAALQDSRLSYQARGILGFVLSLPPDQHLTAAWLETQAPNGRESIRSALRELEKFGYFRRSRRQNELGHWAWDQILSDAAEPNENTLPYDGNPSDGTTADGSPSDKRPNTEDRKDVGPVDMASRRARAKAASATLTVSDAINAVRRAITIEHSAADAETLTDAEALGLCFTYVGNRRPRDLVAYLGKILGDSPSIDAFLSNSSAACPRCCHWESDCACPAA